MTIYNVNTPVKRALWKNHEIIDYVIISLCDRDKLNKLQHEFYLGFTEDEHKILNDGTEEELLAAGFISRE